MIADNYSEMNEKRQPKFGLSLNKENFSKKKFNALKQAKGYRQKAKSHRSGQCWTRTAF